MLYQDTLTGYLYEVPDTRFYAGKQMVYDGLGNPLGFLAPMRAPAAFQAMHGFHQAESPPPEMQPTAEMPPPGPETPTPMPAPVRPVRAPTPFEPVPAPMPFAPPPGAEFEHWSPSYCYCRPQRLPSPVRTASRRRYLPRSRPPLSRRR